MIIIVLGLVLAANISCWDINLVDSSISYWVSNMVGLEGFSNDWLAYTNGEESGCDIDWDWVD